MSQVFFTFPPKSVHFSLLLLAYVLNFFTNLPKNQNARGIEGLSEIGLSANCHSNKCYLTYFSQFSQNLFLFLYFRKAWLHIVPVHEVVVWLWYNASNWAAPLIRNWICRQLYAQLCMQAINFDMYYCIKTCIALQYGRKDGYCFKKCYFWEPWFWWPVTWRALLWWLIIFWW